MATRSRSHSRSGTPKLQRTVSLHYPDDHSVYHGHDSFNTSPASSIHTSIDLEKAETEHEPEAEVHDGIADENDEPEVRPQRTKSKREDPNLVTWNGPDDPENPKNWTFKQKWAATAIVSLFTLISPISSSMVAPALPAIGKELNIQSIELQLSFSIFVLAYAIGPLFLGPLSELYGRTIVLQSANLIFLVFNSACGGAKNKAEMIAFRFLSGIGGSAPLAIGGGVLSDLFRAHERGKAVSLYSLAPLLGPALGPIMGGFITENISWRWIFWVVSFADVGVQVAGLFFLRETYVPLLLQRKKQRLIKETGNELLHTEYDTNDTLLHKIGTSLIRPFRLLGTQLIVQVLAVYMAYLYGLMYLVLSTFPTLWTERYHESVGIAGLNYISLGLGFFLGAQVGSRINDRIYRRLSKKSPGRPEFRVPLMVPGAVMVPIGLFIYGWSAQARTHWIVPNIGTAIFSAGVIMGFQCIQTYIVDAYTRYAASAIGAATVLRSLAGFGFPLFAPALYRALDYGWGNSVLAFVGIAIGFPGPFMLWRYGEKLRKKSTFAAGDF